jgi:O-antigen ligase
MSIGLVYWILFLIWILFNGWGYYTPNGALYRDRGNSLLLVFLMFILGWRCFGFIIHE